MKKAGMVLLILFATVLCSIHVKAQFGLFNTNNLSTVNVDNYSDAELQDMYKKAKDAGLTETRFFQIAAERNLPSAEITKLKNRLHLAQNVLRPGDDAVSETESSQNNLDARRDTLSSTPVQKFKNDATIFGSELFTTNSLVFEPNLRIPAPAGYILGPDDEIIISIFGYSEKRYSLRVNEQGDIYIPNVGPIAVNGLSLERAEDKIRSKLSATIYKAIRSGQTKVQVSLGKIKSIRVTVIGQAKKPGSYTVSSLTTLYNILYLCGGPTDMGSYRAIEIIRGNGVKRTADLYDFLVNGIQNDNVILKEGDVVRIQYYKNRVTITGKVKRTGKFELTEKETFDDLLKYSGGFTDEAYRGAVTVLRITDTARKIIDLSSSGFNTFQSYSSDEYIVGRLQDEYWNRVVVSGSVTRPGPYELDQQMTVKDLLNKAGGLKVDAYTNRASIFRFMQNKTPSILSVNLDSILNYNQQVYLQKNDSLDVHSLFEFRDTSYVSIEGNVRKPGLVRWREHFALRDLLLAVGGLTESGDSSSIEISRRIKNADIDEPDHPESKVFSINLASLNDLYPDVYLQPYDIVIVKTIPGYTVQRSVLILGEVKSPGKYGLEKSADRISDIIYRTGGFKASADSSSITLRRNAQSNLTVGEREQLFQRILNIDPDSLSQQPRLKDELYRKYDLISVDLSTALNNPGSSENLALEDGDILSVDRNTNLVKISGEVYFPTIVPFQQNRTLKYYVQQAGNFTPYARKTGALVIHPDGKAESVKHFLWFKSYPSVTPRSEIFVPQKLKNNRPRVGAGELALIVSALGILANVIINITK